MPLSPQEMEDFRRLEQEDADLRRLRQLEQEDANLRRRANPQEVKNFFGDIADGPEPETIERAKEFARHPVRGLADAAIGAADTAREVGGVIRDKAPGALPVALGTAGGVGGGVLGLKTGQPVLGAVVGAGLGEATGEGLRQLIEGETFNMEKVERAAKFGAGSEFLGGAIVKVGGKFFTRAGEAIQNSRIAAEVVEIDALFTRLAGTLEADLIASGRVSPEDAKRMAQSALLPSEAGADSFVTMIQDTLESARGTARIENFRAAREVMIERATHRYVEALSPHMRVGDAVQMIKRRLQVVVKESADEVGVMHARVASNVSGLSDLAGSVNKLAGSADELAKRRAVREGLAANPGTLGDDIAKGADRRVQQSQAESLLHAQRTAELTPVLEEMGVPDAKIPEVIARIADAGPNLGKVDVRGIAKALERDEEFLVQIGGAFNKDFETVIDQLKGLATKENGGFVDFEAVKRLRTGFSGTVKDLLPGAKDSFANAQGRVQSEMTKAMEKALKDADKALGLGNSEGFFQAWGYANDATKLLKSSVNDDIVRALIADIDKKKAGKDAINQIININNPNEIDRWGVLIGKDTREWGFIKRWHMANLQGAATSSGDRAVASAPMLDFFTRAGGRETSEEAIALYGRSHADELATFARGIARTSKGKTTSNLAIQFLEAAFMSGAAAAAFSGGGGIGAAFLGAGGFVFSERLLTRLLMRPGLAKTFAKAANQGLTAKESVPFMLRIVAEAGKDEIFPVNEPEEDQ